jgi:hypothetical protein
MHVHNRLRGDWQNGIPIREFGQGLGGSRRKKGPWLFRSASDRARSMPEYTIAPLKPGRSSRPACLEAGIKKFVRGRSVVPDGDRLHNAQSGGVINKDQRFAPRDYYVVSEFVLDNDLRDDLGSQNTGGLALAPVQHIR